MAQREIPAPGFRLVSGKRGPKGGEWFIQLRTGFVDERVAYTPDQLVWKHDGGSGDIVAVKPADGGKGDATWNPKSGGY